MNKKWLSKCHYTTRRGFGAAIVLFAAPEDTRHSRHRVASTSVALSPLVGAVPTTNTITPNSTSRENCSVTCPLSIRDVQPKAVPPSPVPESQGGFIRRVHFDKAAKVQAEEHTRTSLLQNGSHKKQAALSQKSVGPGHR